MTTQFQGAYTAYPIDQHIPQGNGFYSMIEDFMQSLLAGGIVAWTFDPGDAFKVTKGEADGNGIMRINRSALRSSDVLVAFLPAGVPSIGVPGEIERAVQDGMPTLVFSDASAWMLQYTAPHFHRVHGFDEKAMQQGFAWLSNQSPADRRLSTDPWSIMLAEGGQMPTKAHEGDAGFDLYVSEETVIGPGEFVDVPCGVEGSELPFYSWGFLTGRSSTLRKKGLLVHTAIIDTGYRGPLYAGAWNTTQEPVRIMRGERIAQLIPLPNQARYIVPTQTHGLTKSERGTDGFGSSGA